MTTKTAAQSPAEIMATAPSLSWSPNYHGHPSIKMCWTLDDSGPKTEVVNVRIAHYVGAKQFVAYAYRAQVTDNGSVSSEFYSPMNTVQIETEGVKRYSRKAHIAFAKRVEEAIMEGRHPGLVRLFDAATAI